MSQQPKFVLEEKNQIDIKPKKGQEEPEVGATGYGYQNQNPGYQQQNQTIYNSCAFCGGQLMMNRTIGLKVWFWGLCLFTFVCVWAGFIPCFIDDWKD